MGAETKWEATGVQWVSDQKDCDQWRSRKYSNSKYILKICGSADRLDETKRCEEVTGAWEFQTEELNRRTCQQLLERVADGTVRKEQSSGSDTSGLRHATESDAKQETGHMSVAPGQRSRLRYKFEDHQHTDHIQDHETESDDRFRDRDAEEAGRPGALRLGKPEGGISRGSMRRKRSSALGSRR